VKKLASRPKPVEEQVVALREEVDARVRPAALLAHEGRGAHTRIDFFSERDDPWLKVNIVTKKGPDGAMLIEQVVRPAPPEDLRIIANATLEDLEAGKV